MPHPPTSLRIFISNNLATLHHELHALERGHIFQRIPVNRDESAHAPGSRLPTFPTIPADRRIHRRGFDGLERVSPSFTITANSCAFSHADRLRIGTEGDLHPTGKRVSDVLTAAGMTAFAFPAENPGLVSFRIFQEPVSEVKRGHQICAIFLHLGDVGIVNVRAVFDRIHSGFRRPQNSLRSVRMGSNFSSQAVGIGHNRPHFLQRVLRCLRIVAFR